MWVCLHTDPSRALACILQEGRPGSGEQAAAEGDDAPLSLHSRLLSALQVQTHVLRCGKPKLQMLAVQVTEYM